MEGRFWTYLQVCFDLFARPRDSERRVRELSAHELRALRSTASGALPYRHREVQALVWECKYYANPRALALAADMLEEALTTLLEEELGRPLLIPVPMHPERRRERGHNQTELLAEQVLHRFPGGYEYAPRALSRERHTPTQQGLSEHARRRNLRHSMQASPGVAGRVCVVLDDVMTTGATFAEATRALRAAGARAVHTVALAQA